MTSGSRKLIIDFLQTFDLDDDGTCKNCGENEDDHIGDEKICLVIFSGVECWFDFG